MSSSRTVCAVQARTGSTRLPGKVLLDLDGRPMLAFLLDRLSSLDVDEVVCATSDLPPDDKVAQVASAAGVRVVRGSESDVLDRYLTVLQETGATTLVRLTGDCPLIDPHVVQDVLALHRARQADYTSNVLPRTFPKGLDVEVVQASALRTAAAEATAPEEREHVTPFLYRRPERFRLANLSCPLDLGDEWWTVDTADDLANVRAIAAQLADPVRAGWEDVLVAYGRRAKPTHDRLSLRPARDRDSGDLLRWRNDPQTVRFSRTPRAVEPQEHQQWWEARRHDAGTRTWIGEIGGLSAGFVRIDVHAAEGEVSIAVDPAHRGAGRGGQLLAALDDRLRPDFQVRLLRAVVHEDNEPSLRMFARAGYLPESVDGAWRSLVKPSGPTASRTATT